MKTKQEKLNYLKDKKNHTRFDDVFNKEYYSKLIREVELNLI